MAGEPKFYTRNYLDADAYLASDDSDMTATLPRLYDRDDSLVCQSSGVATDATPVILEIRFQKAGVEMDRTYDTIVLLGHNLATFTVKYWDGAAWQTETGGAITDQTAAYTVFTFAARTSKRVQITMSTTQTPDQEKQVGEILVLSTLFAFPTGDGFSRLGFAPEVVGTFTPTADRGVIVTLFKWAGARVDRYKARMSFTLLSKANYDSLLTVVRAGECTVYPEPTERPDEFYQGTMAPAGAPSSFASSFKGPGYVLDLEFVEN